MGNIKGLICFHFCLDLGENLAPEMASNVFLQLIGVVDLHRCYL